MKLQIHTGALLVATLGMIGTSFGAGAPAVPDSLRACASKQDVLQRLSCQLPQAIAHPRQCLWPWELRIPFSC